MSAAPGRRVGLTLLNPKHIPRYIEAHYVYRLILSALQMML